jgi:hypothetical protein
MTRTPPQDPFKEAKLLGILLAGVFSQTRPDCSVEARLRLELRPSGVHRIELPKPDREPKA